MNWAELVACIGAAAWLPHILRWFYIWFSKPELRFVPESSVEIGYTTLGLYLIKPLLFPHLKKMHL